MIIRARKENYKKQNEKSFLKRCKKKLGRDYQYKTIPITPVSDMFGISGVYFLYKEEHLVYIGESGCVMSRISTKIRNKKTNI